MPQTTITYLCGINKTVFIREILDLLCGTDWIFVCNSDEFDASEGLKDDILSFRFLFSENMKLYFG
jgi:hypothetical protein